nr:hypothetical protein Iba_chr13cCG14800 [Ipomoea batatas]
MSDSDSQNISAQDYDDAVEATSTDASSANSTGTADEVGSHDGWVGDSHEVQRVLVCQRPGGLRIRRDLVDHVDRILRRRLRGMRPIRPHAGVQMGSEVVGFRVRGILHLLVLRFVEEIQIRIHDEGEVVSAIGLAMSVPHRRRQNDVVNIGGRPGRFDRGSPVLRHGAHVGRMHCRPPPEPHSRTRVAQIKGNVPESRKTASTFQSGEVATVREPGRLRCLTSLQCQSNRPFTARNSASSPSRAQPHCRWSLKSHGGGAPSPEPNQPASFVLLTTAPPST